MKKQTFFGLDNIGCYADGSHGDEYVSSKAVDLALTCIRGNDYPIREAMCLMEDLLLRDRYKATKLALEVLNNHCTPEVSFEFHEGDLMLLKVEDMD